jgi:transcription initiation factor TFIIIB Brf1 subunit/transcription initiation factor TFIIB
LLISFQTSKPEEYLPRFCNNLPIDDSVLNIIKIILHRSNKLGISTKKPQSTTAGAIYYVIDKLKIPNITRSQISEACDTSEVTLNTCYKIFEKYHKILFLGINI